MLLGILRLFAVENFQNPSEQEIRELLVRVRTIAVVGLSPRPNRPSYKVASQLQRFGYRIIPVRPAVESVLGEKAYASLREVPEKIDLVMCFARRSMSTRSWSSASRSICPRSGCRTVS